MGLRMPELRKDAPKILVMGDSYTEGFGLSNKNTFPAQLEKALGGQWQVLNGGVIGFSPALYSHYLKEKLATLGAKYVLLNLDFTDLNDDVYYLSNAEYDSEGNLVGFPNRELFPSAITNLVYKNKLALLRFAHQEANLWARSKLQEKNLKFLEKKVAEPPSLIHQEWLNQNPDTQNCWKNFELTAKLIQDLKNEVKKMGGKLAIHMYPPGYFLKTSKRRPQTISFWQKWQSLKNKNNDFSCGMSFSAEKVFEKYAVSQGIPFFSSIEFIKNYPNKEKLYFEEDAHWNKDGVKVVTASLAPKLEKDFLKLSVKQGKRSGQ